MYEKFSLDDDLSVLLAKNGICRFDNKNILDMDFSYCNYCEYRINCSHGKIRALIWDLFDKISDEQIVVIRGAGRHTIELLTALRDKKRKIKYIADKYAQIDELYDIPVVRTNDLKDIKVDLVIISSFAFREEIKKELLELDYNMSNIVDIYDYLADNGVALDTPFYGTHAYARYSQNSADYVVNWRGIITRRIIYNNVLCTNNDTLIQKYLYELILSYLFARDFINAKRFIETYMQRKYQDFNMFKSFSIDLVRMFALVKDRIRKKEGKNIIVFHFDALDNDMIEYMKYMKRLKDRSSVFTNAFTQNTHTTSTFQTIFTQRDLIDDRAYEVETFDADNSKLLQIIADNDYCFIMLPTGKDKLFEKVNTVSKNKVYVITNKFWSLLQLLIDNDKVFCYVHALETHAPYSCGLSDVWHGSHFEFLELSENERASHLLKSLAFVDEQFEFYNSIIPDSNIKIVMSDHGHTRLLKIDDFHVNNCVTYDNMVYRGSKTVLFFWGGEFIQKQYKEVFSLNNFSDLISYLMGLTNDSLLFQSFSKLQVLPVYAKSLIEEYRKRNITPFLPAKGIATKHEKYLIDYNGNETYQTFLSDNFRINRIDEPEYQERINELRELCGNDFYEIFEQPKFALAKEFCKEKGLI